MPTPSDSEIPDPVSEQGTPDVDLSRRKLGMGLGVSAVFTLASRPVLAQQCVTPSSAASGNLSTHGETPTCTGLSPAQWVGSPAGQYPGDNVNFHTVFKSGSRAEWFTINGGNTNFNTLKEVMEAGDNNNTTTKPNPISKEFAAALLNIRDDRIPDSVLDETGLIGMWNEWMDTGTFAPKAGASWNTGQIVTYLQTLQS